MPNCFSAGVLRRILGIVFGRFDRSTRKGPVCVGDDLGSTPPCAIRYTVVY